MQQNQCKKLILSLTTAIIYFADKRLKWPTLFREWFGNSEANRLEICSRLRQRVEINVSTISPESVKFHSMKLTMMFKLNFE